MRQSLLFILAPTYLFGDVATDDLGVGSLVGISKDSRGSRSPTFQVKEEEVTAELDAEEREVEAKLVEIHKKKREMKGKFFETLGFNPVDATHGVADGLDGSPPKKKKRTDAGFIED